MYITYIKIYKRCTKLWYCTIKRNKIFYSFKRKYSRIEKSIQWDGSLPDARSIVSACRHRQRKQKWF